jgi:cob(I)alamin adenosyltransferase
MVVLNRIYTKTGDDGETSLVTGVRVPKDDLRIACYGTVDETNSAIGIARVARTALTANLDAMLGRIQNDLFDLGSDLATPEEPKPAFEIPRIQESQVARLEAEIDEMNAYLAPLNSFVLPGGTPAAAHLHLARTICRRAERLTVELSRREKVGVPALKYLNRLSDHLFVASRFANDKGEKDVLWVPGANR